MAWLQEAGHAVGGRHISHDGNWSELLGPVIHNMITLACVGTEEENVTDIGCAPIGEPDAMVILKYCVEITTLCVTLSGTNIE